MIEEEKQKALIDLHKENGILFHNAILAVSSISVPLVANQVEHATISFGNILVFLSVLLFFFSAFTLLYSLNMAEKAIQGFLENNQDADVTNEKVKKYNKASTYFCCAGGIFFLISLCLKAFYPI